MAENLQKEQKNGLDPLDHDGDLSQNLTKWGGHIGTKNRNPGNLRYANIGWDGEVGSEGGFSKFNKIVYGTRAMMKNMNTLIKRGNTSIKLLLNQWAPQCENDTVGYIRTVSKKTDINADSKILQDISKQKSYCIAIAKSIAWVEDHIEFKDSCLEQAYNLATGGGSDAGIQTGENTSSSVPQASATAPQASAQTSAASLTAAQKTNAISYNKRTNQSICKQIQRLVGVADDGSFGPITVTAIAQWQAKNGLTVDGCFGPQSKAKANFTASAPQSQAPAAQQAPAAAQQTPAAAQQQAPAATQSTGSAPAVSYTGSDSIKKRSSNKRAVNAIQTYLNAYGFNVGKVDEDFGLATLTQVMRYQYSRGLLIDGEVGTNTWNAFRSNMGAVNDLKSTDAYENGRKVGKIELKKLSGGCGLMLSKGADQFEKMVAARGKHFQSSCSYRGMTNEGTQAVEGNNGTKGQIELRAMYLMGTGNPASKPGYSNHQNGRAIDIKESSAKSWIKKNGPAYGFHGISSEDWHFNYNG